MFGHVNFIIYNQNLQKYFHNMYTELYKFWYSTSVEPITFSKQSKYLYKNRQNNNAIKKIRQ